MDVEFVRVRVLEFSHSKYGEVGTVPLREFERAARSGRRGEFVALFESGSASVAVRSG